MAGQPAPKRLKKGERNCLMLTLLDPTLDPARLTLIVYDLDGTLVDAFEDIWSGVNHALGAHGLAALPYATVRSYVGDGARMLIRRCVGQEHQDRYEDVYHFYRSYYEAHPVDRAHTYPGALEMLGRLRARGLRQAVLSNKPDEVTRQACEHLGLARLLDGLWGEHPGRPRKPDARSLQTVMEHFAAVPGETLFVGDGPADCAVASAAGVRFVAVTYGLLSRAQLEPLRPGAIVDALDELRDFLAP